MERGRRLVFVLLAAVLFFLMFHSGHGVPSKEAPVAFLSSPSLPVVVKVTGDVQAPGIYRFPHGATVAAVINLTMPYSKNAVSDPVTLATVLNCGDLLRVRSMGRQYTEITIAAMKARERMILGIPLDPDRMNSDDWDALPGIGPVMAKKLIDDRQEYGVFGSLENLQRVPGIGKSKIERLGPYFKH
ncbi:MAG: helix-hairpin-helix domain-containing protein [Geobacteraceae bacterium]